MKNAQSHRSRWHTAVHIAVGLSLIAASYVWLPKAIYFARESFHEEQADALVHAQGEELSYVRAQAEDIAADVSIKDEIREHDLLAVSAITVDEAKRRRLYSISAIDEDGVVLSRSAAPFRRGDYIFDKTDWGLRVSAGELVYGFEESMSGIMLFARASAPIKEEGNTIGAISVIQNLDDEYANTMQSRYLDISTEIAFYTSRGVVGSSLDVDERASFRAIFPDTESINSIAASGPEKEIKIGQYRYGVQRIPLPGIDLDHGGIIVLHRHQLNAEIIIATALLTVLFFLLQILLHIFFYHAHKHEKHNLILVFFSTLAFFATIAVIFHFRLQPGKIDTEDGAFRIYNSTIIFKPDFDVVDKAFQQHVIIAVASGPESINAAQAEVFFDPTMLRVTDIMTTKSFCSESIFPEKTIDNEQGRVFVACAVPNPGFLGEEGILAELVIEPIKSGSFSLKFGDQTKVLANDGLGTDVLRLRTDGYYRVLDRADTLIFPPLVVFSKSHPNGERWYNKRMISFSWRRHADATYRYALNQTPEYMPGPADPQAANSTLALIAPGDGIYYFHLARIENGKKPEVIHKRIQIDSTAPPAPLILASNTRIKAGEIVRFDFKNMDNPAQAQLGFYVKFREDDIFLPVKPPLYVPFAEEGIHTVHVKVFDKAGNANQSSAQIEVTEK